MPIRDQSESGPALGFTAVIDLQFSIKNKMEVAMYSNWWNTSMKCILHV